MLNIPAKMSGHGREWLRESLLPLAEIFFVYTRTLNRPAPVLSVQPRIELVEDCKLTYLPRWRAKACTKVLRCFPGCCRDAYKRIAISIPSPRSVKIWATVGNYPLQMDRANTHPPYSRTSNVGRRSDNSYERVLDYFLQIAGAMIECEISATSHTSSIIRRLESEIPELITTRIIK